MEAKPKPRFHEVDVEAEGAEEAQARYEGIESSFKGKVDHPAIISDVVKEMDDFFLTKKPKHEDVFELNFYKLHEDIQQAVMEYQKRIDFLKEKQRKHGLTDDERELNHNFKQQVSHLEKIFAHFSDNPNQAKKDAQTAYESYAAWRGKTENAILEAKQEDKTQDTKSKNHEREDMTESLRIIEDTREYDDSELSISLNKTLLEVRSFLSDGKPSSEEARL